MSLYGNDDSNANKTKAGIGIGASSQAKTVVFIDDTEAQLKSNKDRGLNAPGWWSYFTYTDSHGKTRHKAEQLVYIAKPEANAQETQADDTIGADVLETITITGQPANSTSSSEAGTFAVTVSVDQSVHPHTYGRDRQPLETDGLTSLLTLTQVSHTLTSLQQPLVTVATVIIHSTVTSTDVR